MTIEVGDDTVRIDDYETEDVDVVKYFEELDNQQKNLEDELGSLLKLGVVAAKAGSVGLSTDYVDKEMTKLQEHMIDSIDAQFGEKGAIRELLTDHFGVDGIIAKQLLDPSAQGTPINELRTILLAEIEKIKIKLNIQEAEQSGTAHGFGFEDYCQTILEKIAADSKLGEEVEKTGDQKGLIDKKGDYVYTITDPASKIVLEMKDEQGITLPYIKKQLDGGIQNRGAQYGIFVTKQTDLSKKVGRFNEYDGNKLVIVLGSELEDEVVHDELLRVAIGWARLKLKQQSGQGPTLDTGKIRTKIQSVEAKIAALTNVKSKCTSIENDTEAIRSIVASVKDDIAEDLEEITKLLNA